MTGDLRRRIRLVALDLDGTTLDDAKQLRPRTERAIRSVCALGVRVCFVTGRMLGSTARYAAQAGLDGPHVVLNGSLVTHEPGEPLYCGRLPTDLVAALARVGEDGATPFAMTRGELLTDRDAAEHWTYMRTWNNGEDQRTVPTLTALASERVYQLHWIGPREVAQRIAAAITDDRVRPVVFDSARGPHVHLEVRISGTHKATGLAHLQRHHGVTPEQTLAMGDWLNDREMLTAAGFGVAMGNATDEIKTLADHVLDRTNDEDGVADFLERTFLTEA